MTCKLFCIILILYISKGFSWKLLTRFDRFELCQCADPCVIKNYEYHIVQPERENSYFNSKFTLTEDVDIMKITVVPQRCSRKEMLDSCEKISPFNSENVCQIAKMKKTMWSTFVYSFNPPFACPMKKGNYVSVNSSFDSNYYKVLPLDGYYYKSNLMIFNGTGKKNFLWSFCLEFAVIKLF